MWLKLLKADNLEKLFKPKLVNGVWRQAEINGRKRNLLRKWFYRAGLPWIFKPIRPPIDTASIYNKEPKGNGRQRSMSIRIAEIRKNLLEMDGKVREYRQKHLDGRPYRGMDRVIKDTLLALGKTKKKGESGVVKAAASSTGIVKKPKRESIGAPLMTRKEKALKDLTLEMLK